MAQQAWKLLDRTPSDASVDVETMPRPDGSMAAERLFTRTQDYAMALILNEDGQALILEGYRHSLGRTSWQVPGGGLRPGEQPGEGIARMLVEITGYQANSWRHLASLVSEADQQAGVGHFFLGRNISWVGQPIALPIFPYEIKWLRLGELKRALWDGRIAGTNYATTISLGLLALGHY